MGTIQCKVIWDSTKFAQIFWQILNMEWIYTLSIVVLCMISGHDSEKTKINAPVTSGSSGCSHTMNNNKSIPESKTVLKQNNRRTELPTPTMEQAQKSRMLSLQPNHTLTAKNPYVLNKKEIPPLSSVKTVAQKSALKWEKPSAASASGLSSDESKSHIDSELYRKKSQLLQAGTSLGKPSTKVKSSTMVPLEAPSTYGAHGSFKWSKSKPSASSNKEKKGKKSKPSRSKLKWTKLGAQVEAKKVLNPYVLKKESPGGGNACQRHKLTSNKAKKLEKQPHCSSKYQVHEKVGFFFFFFFFKTKNRVKCCFFFLKERNHSQTKMLCGLYCL